jgi:ribonucleoside-diphosphate reductase alpha chain
MFTENIKQKPIYTYPECYNASMDYFHGDEMAATTWIKKYCLKDECGNYLELTPADSHRRYAAEFARIEYSYLKDICKWEKKMKDLSPAGQKRMEKIKNMSVDELTSYFFGWLEEYRFIIPAGSVMENLGTDRPVSISNCFFNGVVGDSVEEIFKMALDMSQTGKRRGGSGCDISGLRPKGAKTNNSSRYSSGPVEFMILFDTAGKIIGQQGRKMAEIIIMDCRHPDIIDFIKSKQNTDAITNANISVKFHDDFILAVENDGDYLLRYPVDITDYSPEEHDVFPVTEYDKNIENYEYDRLYDLGSNCYIKRVRAKKVWDSFISANRNFAEPGFFNWDMITDYDPAGVYSDLQPEGTNPCGEQPLSTHDSCRLLSTNLYSLVEHPFTESSKINTELAETVFYEAQVMCDMIVDLEMEHVERIINKLEAENPEKDTQEIQMWQKIYDKGKLGRRTGTGFTAFGDMMAALGLPYGEAETTDRIMELKMTVELEASIDMAIIKGVFPIWSRYREYLMHTEGYIQKLKGCNSWYRMLYDKYPDITARMFKHGRRNSGLSTVAPNGTLSLMTMTTSGIEPLFMPYYTRRRVVTDGETADFTDENGNGYKEFTVVHEKLKTFALVNSLVSKEKIGELKENEWKEIYEKSPYKGQTASEIEWEDRVATQGRIQKYITSSISSTINLPETVTLEEVDTIYRNAFKYRLKGCTIYRDGSRSGILVATKTAKDPCVNFVTHNAPKRPEKIQGDFYKIKHKGVNYLIIVGLYCERPYELYCFIPTLENIEMKTSFSKIRDHQGLITKTGKNHYSFTSAHIYIPNLTEFNNDEEKRHSIRTSLELRHGIPIEYIIKCFKKYDDNVVSFSSVCARILSKYTGAAEIKNGEKCPECGSALIHEAGCIHCSNCDYSRCT